MNPENRRGASIQLANIDTILQEERPQQNNAVREDRFHYLDEIRRGSKKSGRLPKNNGIPWRGDSGLKDGVDNKKCGLVGGYYDSGINLKYNFPMSFALTLLSWSVLEYEHKYHSSGEHDHVRDLIRWGTDYILLTFDSNSSSIDKVYSQVGSRDTGFGTPNDETCWERPEDMDYDERPVHTAPDLGGEMAAALAAASIVFVDDVAYSEILITMFSFARDTEKQEPYSWYGVNKDASYNSTGFWDEHVWGATWLYYATGDDSYLALATDPHLAQNANAASQIKYILGTNHLNLSYVVGYGAKFPRHVHHRGASIPNDGIKYSCTGGME